MPSWPATLPLPQRPGYGLESADVTARTEMDLGTARVRRRQTSAPDEVSVKMLLTEAQMGVFRAFWDNDIHSAADWFDMPIRDGRGGGLVTKSVRAKPAKFKAAPASGVYWSLSFSVEVRNA